MSSSLWQRRERDFSPSKILRWDLVVLNLMIINCQVHDVQQLMYLRFSCQAHHLHRTCLPLPALCPRHTFIHLIISIRHFNVSSRVSLLHHRGVSESSTLVGDIMGNVSGVLAGPCMVIVYFTVESSTVYQTSIHAY